MASAGAAGASGGEQEPVSQHGTTVAETIASFLGDAGISRVFGYPGDPNVELIEALRLAGIEFVLARREGTAGFMAEADGLLGSRPGVAISTLGPGSTALVNAVANAYLDRAPMLAISGQITAQLEGLFTHQVIDHGRLFAPVTKWATRVDARTVGHTLRRAHRTATAERPGPVHLTTHADTLTRPAGDVASVPPFGPSSGIAGVHGGTPRDVVAAIDRARKPVALVGPAVVRADATHALRRYVERTTTPVVVSPMAKGALDEQHACFVGTIDMACAAVIQELLAASDLVLAIGFDPAELIKSLPSVPMLHIDAIENVDQVYAADLEVVGGITATLEWLTQAVADGPRWSEQAIAGIRGQIHDGMRAGAVPGRLNPSDVLDALISETPPDAIVTTDVGSHKLLVSQGWPSRAPHSFLVSNGLSAMGFALPAGIAAQLRHPERPVVITVGDGGFAMVAGELQVAASLGLRLLVVVLVDESLNRIELKQQVRDYPSIGTRIDPSDIARVAEGFGCIGATATTPAELQSILAAPRPAGQPLVVDARIDPTQYRAQFS